MNRDLEYKFFREFQYDGAAILTLKMAHYKYCGIGSDVPARIDYPDGVLGEIRERTETFNTWPWSGIVNYCPLFDEIIDNLDSCTSDTTDIETEIDNIVYHLYGLTYDEVQIVDPETTITREE